MVVMVGRSAAEARWTMRGSHEGRCLAAKILAMASDERALAPRPYTVSVAKATVPPSRRMLAASGMPVEASRWRVVGTLVMVAGLGWGGWFWEEQATAKVCLWPEWRGALESASFVEL